MTLDTMRLIEALGSLTGLAGAFMLASNRRWSGFGWLVFLASNACWLLFAWWSSLAWLFAQQIGFTCTSLLGIWRWLLRPHFQWTEWRGDFDGNPTMWIMPIARWRGRRFDLHKMVGLDMPECFHTHPARALRVPIWGGYDEEIFDIDPAGMPPIQRGQAAWKPGMVGIVRPHFAHRISRLHNGRVSYSLWLRGRKSDKVRLVGSGWGDREGMTA